MYIMNYKLQWIYNFDEVISGRDCDELKNFLAECGEVTAIHAVRL